LHIIKEWIVSGRVPSENVPHNDFQLQVTSNSKSKVEVLKDMWPSPGPVVLKMVWLDKVQHTLDKGPWAATLAVHQGWKIFVEVSSLSLCCRTELTLLA